MSEQTYIPDFLTSYDALSSHFSEHFEAFDGNERGDAFLNFAFKFLKLSDIGRSFPLLRMNNKVSWDGGVDIFSSSDDSGRNIYVQSKYKIKTKEDIDGVFSKFQNYQKTKNEKNAKDLFSAAGIDQNESDYFAIITFSKVERILKKYKESSLSSRYFFDALSAKGSVKIIDGNEIFLYMKAMYEKIRSSIEVRLSSPAGWVSSGNVYLGVVSASDIRALYAETGDSLFFENVRNFLAKKDSKDDFEPSPVNTEIIMSARENPERFLEKNNGITFKAAIVDVEGNNSIILKGAGIVNGCQTTVCLHRAGELPTSCMVSVKVIRTDDAWDVTKSANNQNEVARIDLELSKFLRPQLVNRKAADLGYRMTPSNSSSLDDIISSIYSSDVEYEEMRALYIGLFSRQPRNMFDAIYSDVRFSEISQLYKGIGGEDKVLEIMFRFVVNIRNYIDACEKMFSGAEYSNLFKRIFDDDRPRYRVYLGILAASVTMDIDISSRDNDPKGWVRQTIEFLQHLNTLLENKDQELKRNYIRSLKVIINISLERDDKDIKSYLYNEFKKPFASWYRRVQIQRDVDKPMT